MAVSALERSALLSVKPYLIQAYLRTRGWEEYGNYRGAAIKYRKAENKILAPIDNNIADYAQAVNDILAVLAEVETRSVQQIFNDIILADKDIIRIRVPSAEGQYSVSVSKGKMLIEQSYVMLMAAARSVCESQAVYRSRPNKEVIDYIDSLQLGQTEKGSFVLTLLSDTAPQLGGEDDVFDSPFGRKTTLKLREGLISLNEAVGQMTIMAFEERVKNGVSANLCESVAALAQDEVDISISYALNRPVKHGASRYACTFRKDASDILKAAGESLKQKTPIFDQELQGFITKLHRERSEEAGVATLKAVIDGNLRPFSIHCGGELYNFLHQAHGKRSEVGLEGDIKPQGREWIVENPRKLRIIEDDES